MRVLLWEEYVTKKTSKLYYGNESLLSPQRIYLVHFKRYRGYLLAIIISIIIFPIS